MRLMHNNWALIQVAEFGEIKLEMQWNFLCIRNATFNQPPKIWVGANAQCLCLSSNVLNNLYAFEFLCQIRKCMYDHKL